MLVDGRRPRAQIRSRTKLRRQQRTFMAALVMSLVVFSCANEKVTGVGVRPEASTGGGKDSASEATDGSGGAASTTAPVAGVDGPIANESDYDGWVDPASSGNPWTTTPAGILTFRGNPTRSWYGAGPVPTDPEVLWSRPDSGGFCSESTVGSTTKTWCGTGWTGQPSVWVGPDERTWVAFGAYDAAVHVLDAATGDDILEPFQLGDIIKGSVTIDPDGYPLLYTGSRDNEYHILALDRGEAMEELWTLDAEAVSPTLWNDDWDGSGLIIDDYLFEGGENSQLHIVKLNRGRDGNGKVTVDPELVWHAPGWDDQLLEDLAAAGTRGEDVSIENSVAISGNTLYHANSGGLVQGWDIGGLAEGKDPERVFRFWTGDDTDASVVIDDEGFLYVGSEYERGLDRSLEVGQIMKLDPTKPDDPLVWSVADHDSLPAGVWATLALHEDMVYVPTDAGRLLGLDRATGEEVWSKDLAGPTWQSPVVVDDVLLQGDCNGTLHAYDVSDRTIDPPELWTVELEGCIESTPAVWDGRIFVGARGGRFYAIGDL